jgi:acyl carrier protein
LRGGTQRAHLVGIEPVRHLVQVDMLRAHRHEPGIPSVGRPALTAERFTADPFTTSGGRLYRTGDRARWLPGGTLEFLGRADGQLKVRGHRVEPGEVEAALAAHPAVSAAVVTAHGAGEDRRLAACLVPADSRAGLPPVTELREHLAARLPAHMIPGTYTELAALPLTPNGKVDRTALPDPDPDRTGLDPGRYTPPATPLQEQLAGIWQQILGRARVGIHDSFFDLGGHSLLATKAVSRIRDAFGVDIPLAELFERPTIADTATAIEAAAPRATRPEESRLDQYEEFEL